MVETYNKTVNVEGQLMVLMANRYILPAAFEYQKQVAQSVAAVKAAGGKSVEGKKTLDKLTKLIDEFKQRDRQAREGARARSDGRRRSTRSTSATWSCRRWRRCAKPATSSKSIIPHETWPLATYREMLFIK